MIMIYSTHEILTKCSDLFTRMPTKTQIFQVLALLNSFDYCGIVTIVYYAKYQDRCCRRHHSMLRANKMAAVHDWPCVNISIEAVIINAGNAQTPAHRFVRATACSPHIVVCAKANSPSHVVWRLQSCVPGMPANTRDTFARK